MSRRKAILQILMCLEHVMDTEQGAEVLLKEHRSSEGGELDFYRIRQQLRKVSVEMCIGVVTFWGTDTVKS